MQKFKIERKARIAAVILLSILGASFAAYSLVKYTSQVTNTATVKGYEMVLWRTDGTPQAVTAIAWGDLETGTNKTTEQVLGFTQQLFLKNRGDFILYPAWNLSALTPLPNNITLTCEYFASGTWKSLPQNDYNQFAWIPVNGLTAPIRFVLTVPLDAPRGIIPPFIINLLAADTGSG